MKEAGKTREGVELQLVVTTRAVMVRTLEQKGRLRDARTLVSITLMLSSAPTINWQLKGPEICSASAIL